MFRPKMLQVLDLKKFDVMTETALSRMIDHSSRSLTTFKISCKNQAFSRMMCVKLATCRKLEVVEFAAQTEYAAKIPIDQVHHVKAFLEKKRCSLTALRLYECDAKIL